LLSITRLRSRTIQPCRQQFLNSLWSNRNSQLLFSSHLKQQQEQLLFQTLNTSSKQIVSTNPLLLRALTTVEVVEVLWRVEEPSPVHSLWQEHHRPCIKVLPIRCQVLHNSSQHLPTYNSSLLTLLAGHKRLNRFNKIHLLLPRPLNLKTMNPSRNLCFLWAILILLRYSLVLLRLCRLL
jgi:hypothetical protein